MIIFKYIRKLQISNKNEYTVIMNKFCLPFHITKTETITVTMSHLTNHE